MPSENVYGTPTNGDSVALATGMVVRISANKTVVRAQADAAPHVQGLCGVVGSGSMIAPGGPVVTVCDAFRQLVLLETGLTPSAGQTVYVSAAVAGRATNAAPANAVAIGVIEDASPYTLDGRVYVDVQITAGAGAGAGGAPIVMNGIQTGVNQLISLPSSGFGESQQVWVESVEAEFMLLPGALSVDNITVVTASGKPGYQWVRQNAYSRTWESQTTWFIDPQNSSGTASDENTGADITHQLRSYSEHARRWFAAQPSAATVTVSSNLNASDAPSYTCKGPGPVTFQGTLANTVYSGTVTTFTNQSAGAAADDVEIVDATVPVSFTASGMLANAVLFKRTNGAARFFWAAKDNGGAAPACSLRISVPYTSGGGASTLTNGDSYTASTLVTFPPASFPLMDSQSVTLTQLDLTADTRSDVADSQRRTHCWGVTLPNVLHVNPALNLVGLAGGVLAITATAVGTTLNGLIRGSGTQTLQLSSGQFSGNVPTFQGVELLVIAPATYTWLGRISIHDCTGTNAMVVVQEGGRVLLQTNGCLGGKGNTVPLLNVGEGIASVRMSGELFLGVTTPWVAGSTTTVSPITLGNQPYTVAAIAALTPTTGVKLTSGYSLPGGFVSTANGVQSTTLGAVGPAALANPGSPTGWRTELLNGVLVYWPYWT